MRHRCLDQACFAARRPFAAIILAKSDHQLPHEGCDEFDIGPLVGDFAGLVVADVDVSCAPPAGAGVEIMSDHHEVEALEELLAVDGSGLVGQLQDVCHGAAVPSERLPCLLHSVERILVQVDGNSVLQGSVEAFDAVRPSNRLVERHTAQPSVPPPRLVHPESSALSQVGDLLDYALLGETQLRPAE